MYSLLTGYIGSSGVRKSATYGLGLAFCLGADYILCKESERRLHNRIVEKFRIGTKIEVPPIPYYCYRKEVEQLDEVFHSQERKGAFTVVVGPVGCGKTFMVWKTILKNPQVVTF